MPNLHRVAYQLQTALAGRGEYIKINQVQVYVPQQHMMVTKYVIIKTEPTETKNKNTTILETYHFPDVVKLLASIYGGG